MNDAATTLRSEGGKGFEKVSVKGPYVSKTDIRGREHDAMLWLRWYTAAMLSRDYAAACELL